MLEINDKGIKVPSLDEIIDQKVEGYRTIYGSDINLDASTPDGQRIGLESQGVKDAYDSLAYAIQMHDPQYAEGKWADMIASLSGVKRGSGKYTILPDVKITTDRNVLIKAGYTIIKDGSNWILDSDTQLLSGENFLNFRSEFYGEQSLPVNSSLEPQQIILGIKRIESTKSPIMGNLGQNTASLKIDRLRKLAINNTHDREGIEASLLDIDGVIDALVLENNTKVEDSNGVPANSINAIVLGGSSEDIAKTILQKIKGGGCGTFGDQLFTIVNYRGADRKIYFDRPETKQFNVTVTLVRSKPQVDINEDAVKEAIAALDFRIGQDVVAGMLYCFPNDGTFYIESIKIDGADIGSVAILEKANINKDNITVVIR